MTMYLNILKYRIFFPTFANREAEWHTDLNARLIKVIYNKDWKFQFDCNLPFLMMRKTDIYIPAGYWHRVIPGKSFLLISICENEIINKNDLFTTRPVSSKIH